jgi:hypothetical protein
MPAGIPVFTSTIADGLKLTLDEVVDDNLTDYKKKLLMPKWMKQSNMEDNYEDDLEMAGPGLAAEKAEGAEMQAGGIQQGALTRYIARTFALKLIVTEEAAEDSKYPAIIQAAARLPRAMYKTVDIDATNIWQRATNALYTGGDGVPLASASHTLPGGGTFSNLMAVPMSPSRIAVATARTQMSKFPGHDGIIEGVEPVANVCPQEQWYIWDGLNMSEKDPTPGAFNEINVVKKMNLETIPIKYWTSSTTNWALLSDCDNGFKWKWRKKPNTRSWVDNDQLLLKYGIYARWARGWTDARCCLFVNA